jgi:hypothetical protein
MTSNADGCSKSVQTAFANGVRGLALAVWGTHPRDSMLLAQMSVSASINELTKAEDNTKRELSTIVDKVKSMPGNKSKQLVKDLLLRSRNLRSTLTSMSKKRMSMEKQLETLRQSQLNQHMLVSMKHTNEALQKLGLKVSDADNIMLDLEDSHTNINNLQASLSSAFVVDDNVTDMDLSEELELLLSDEYLEPSSVQRKNSEKIATNNSEKIATNNSEKIAEKNSEPTPEPAEPVQEQVLEVITEHGDEQTQETVATTANHL